MSGGLTPYAKRKVVVLRDGSGGRESSDPKDRFKADTRMEFDLDAIISGKRPEFNIVLQPGDTLIFP